MNTVLYWFSGTGNSLHVARFIDTLAPGDAYVFVVMTYGGAPGSAAGITRKMLRRRGIEPAAIYGVQMVENYPPLGGAPPEEKQRQLLDEGERRIGEIVESLKASPRGHVDRARPLFRLLGRLAYPLFRWGLKRSDRKFTADDKCNSCGVCVKVCPIENIELADGRPRWLGRCEQCYACFHLCPQSAVQRGRKTAEQVRYHHPAVTPKDFMFRGE